MPRTVSKSVFKFDELSDDAKEKAREWFRQGDIDNDTSYIYDDAAQCAELLGLDIRTRAARLMSGGTRYEPCIYYSGFSSQGDGACFEGNYSYKADAPKAIRDHAPEDTELHAIADALHSVPHPAGWSASTKHRGHYYHEFCMSVDVSFDDTTLPASEEDQEPELPQDQFTEGEETITEAMRDFARWIYRRLEAEYEYRNADEQVDESIRANGYEFDEDGSCA